MDHSRRPFLRWRSASEFADSSASGRRQGGAIGSSSACCAGGASRALPTLSGPREPASPGDFSFLSLPERRSNQLRAGDEPGRSSLRTTRGVLDPGPETDPNQSLPSATQPRPQCRTTTAGARPLRAGNESTGPEDDLPARGLAPRRLQSSATASARTVRPTIECLIWRSLDVNLPEAG